MNIDEVPRTRINQCNEGPVQSDGDYVLYWMIANRRTRSNFALQHALWRARELGKPLMVMEALRCGYPWASDRLHSFILQGMRDTRRSLDDAGVSCLTYVETEKGEGTGLLEALADRACLVVTDEFPCFFLPRMVQAAATRTDVLLETVDSNGILPLRGVEKAHKRAHYFRRHLQKTLPEHLETFPMQDPLAGYDLGAVELDGEWLERWPDTRAEELTPKGIRERVNELPINHQVPQVDNVRGGQEAGLQVVDEFMERIDDYADGRNHPDEDVSSGLSPWLHFGHVSAHQVLRRILERESWSPDKLGDDTSGKREGWWGMSEGAEGFLDELITWRELGYTFCFHRPDDYADFSSLPDWVLTTLDDHRDDERPYLYDLAEFDAAETHDEIWNAAQRELKRDGKIHNYLRMLWGKKILHWTDSPEKALDIMIELNNRYALDGRDPNSYSGIFWTLGRFDRAWGPEREVFGKVRYMTSKSTRRKLKLSEYLEEFGPDESVGNGV